MNTASSVTWKRLITKMNIDMIDKHEVSFLFEQYRQDYIENGYERQYDG